MKCLLSTTFKLAKVEVNEASVLVKGGKAFREDEGSTVESIVDKYSTKKYKAHFIQMEK